MPPDRRLPSHIEISALCRKISHDGDFATIIHKGDEDRGVIIIEIAEKGQFYAIYERQWSAHGDYCWAETIVPEGPQALAEYRKKRRRSDPDLWWIELDIAHPARFIVDLTTKT